MKHHYVISVTREIHQIHDFDVYAEDEEDAIEKAYELAYNSDWNCFRKDPWPKYGTDQVQLKETV